MKVIALDGFVLGRKYKCIRKRIKQISFPKRSLKFFRTVFFKGAIAQTFLRRLYSHEIDIL